MGFQIEDPSTGKKAAVNDENNLMVRSVMEELDYHINQKSQKVWSLPFEGINPTGNDDYVIYIKNTGTKMLHVTDVRIMADTAATQISITAVSGTAAGGSDITPVNRTIGNANTPDAVVQSGTDITGLTNDGVLFFLQCDTVNREYHLRTSSRIRIPQNKAVGLLVENGTSNVTGVVSIVEEE